jgi:hypothetical protein
MASKPGARNWNDVQLVLAALAMTLTLGLWNLFAGPDSAEARKTAEQQPPMSPITEEPISVDGTPTPLPPIKILLGGVAPQLQVVQQPSARRASRSNGGGGGPVTTTRSS